MSKPRRFKTRNGSIIKESPQENTINLYGFINDYKIIKNKSDNKSYKKGIVLSLVLLKNCLPLGGSFGDGWDIIEEVTK